MSAAASAILAVALAAGALVLALGALGARTLFAACAHLAGLGALAAAAVLLLGAGDGALALAVFAVGLAPVLLMAATLASAPAVRARRAFPWLSIAAAALAAAIVVASMLDLPPQAARAPPRTGALGFWLAPLLLAAAAACVGLLGYGERGALLRRGEEREP